MVLAIYRIHSLWSQHLDFIHEILLGNLLVTACFSNIRIFGIQRYGLTNRNNWLNTGIPSGHKATPSLDDDPAKSEAYDSMLAAQDCIDALVATGLVN